MPGTDCFSVKVPPPMPAVEAENLLNEGNFWSFLKDDECCLVTSLRDARHQRPLGCTPSKSGAAKPQQGKTQKAFGRWIYHAISPDPWGQCWRRLRFRARRPCVLVRPVPVVPSCGLGYGHWGLEFRVRGFELSVWWTGSW